MKSPRQRREGIVPIVRGRRLAQHIAEVAASLFYRHGIHAVGVDRVALAAGVTKRTLYRYFPSKDELVAAALRTRTLQFTPAAGPPRERILGVFDGVIAWTMQPDFRGCPFVNAVVELANRNHPGHAAAVDAKLRRVAWFREQLTDLGAPEPETLAEQLVVIFDGAISSATVRGLRAAQSARALVDLLLNAVESRSLVA